MFRTQLLTNGNLGIALDSDRRVVLASLPGDLELVSKRNQHDFTHDVTQFVQRKLYM